MAKETLKILGQLQPTATTLTDIYVVPTGKGAAISNIMVCNLNESSDNTFSISVAMGGAPDNLSQYYYYKLPISVQNSFNCAIGISLAAGDVVRVWSSDGQHAFNVSGVEVG